MFVEDVFAGICAAHEFGEPRVVRFQKRNE